MSLILLKFIINISSYPYSSNVNEILEKNTIISNKLR
jgi:hypothetical protein